jgi:hypothetical protein
MNPTADQLEIGKAHIEALLQEAQNNRAAHSQAVSVRRRVARWLKRLAVQLEPELQTARA